MSKLYNALNESTNNIKCNQSLDSLLRECSETHKIEVKKLSKLPTKNPDKANKIYDYVEVLSDFHMDSEIEYIKDVHGMESEDKNDNDEYDDLSVYRVIAFDHNKREASIYDYEYHSAEETIIQWKSPLPYESSLEFIQKHGLDDLIIDAETLLESDFIIGMEIYLQ